MLQQYLQTNEDQYNPTNNPRRLLIFGTKDIADFHAQDRKHKGRNANDEHRRPEFDLDTSKGNTHRQGIDAGGNGQKEHRLEIEGTVGRLLFLSWQGFVKLTGIPCSSNSSSYTYHWEMGTLKMEKWTSIPCWRPPGSGLLLYSSMLESITLEEVFFYTARDWATIQEDV